LRGRASTQSLEVVGINQNALRGKDLRISLPDDGSLNLSRTAGETLRNGDLTWSGSIKDAGGTATLILRGGEVIGTIQKDGALYRIAPIGNGAHALVRVDQARLPPDHEPGTPEPEQHGSVGLPHGNAITGGSANEVP
jgi:hypothetical protein